LGPRCKGQRTRAASIAWHSSTQDGDRSNAGKRPNAQSVLAALSAGHRSLNPKSTRNLQLSFAELRSRLPLLKALPKGVHFGLLEVNGQLEPCIHGSVPEGGLSLFQIRQCSCKQLFRQ
jgi:hypothetical protein